MLHMTTHDSYLQCFHSKYEIPSLSQGNLKDTGQTLSLESVSSPDKVEVDPVYDDIESSLQKSKDTAGTDIKIEENAAVDTSVL